MPAVLISAVVLIIGLAILMTTRGHFSSQYAGVHMVCMGAYGAGSIVVCWYLMNLQGHKLRSIGSGWMISVGNSGGIVAPFTFLKKFSPEYTPGYSTCMGAASMGILVTLWYGMLVIRERRKIRNEGGMEHKYVPSI